MTRRKLCHCGAYFYPPARETRPKPWQSKACSEKCFKEIPTKAKTIKPLKPKKCAFCRKEFQPVRGVRWQSKFCGIGCAAQFAAAEVAKKPLIEAKRAKKAANVESLKWWSDQHSLWLHKWIREERDAFKPCVSCGCSHSSEFHAGHYMNAGNHAELRYEEDNIHKQCSRCNTHLSGNLAMYRIELINRIGLERVEWLESHVGHRTVKRTIEWHRERVAMYKNRLRVK